MLRQATPTGGTVGSTINHAGFLVKDIAPWIEKWKAAGLTLEPQVRPTQVYLIGPDDLRVEILEDKTIDAPLKMHHLHFYTASPLEAQAWYAKTFGAVAGERGQFDAADLPGVNLTFAKAETPTVGTKGRSARSHRLRSEEPRSVLPEARSGRAETGSAVHAAAELDHGDRVPHRPMGTYIELTENLAPAKWSAVETGAMNRSRFFGVGCGWGGRRRDRAADRGLARADARRGPRRDIGSSRCWPPTG